MSTEIANPTDDLSFGEWVAKEGARALAARLGEMGKTPEGREKIGRAGTMMANIAARALFAADNNSDKMRPWLDLPAAEWARATKTILDLDLNPVGAVAEVYAFPEKGVLQIRATPAGFVKLAARSGHVLSFAVIREGDDFDFYQDGNGIHFHHRPVFTGSPARSARPMVAVAVVIRRATDGRLLNAVILDADQIDARKAQSKMKGAGPWAKWPEEMAKKSALHRALAEGAIILDLGLEHALSVGAGEYDREVYDVAEEAPRARIVQPPPAPALAAPPPTIERSRPAAPPMYTADGDDGESYADPPSNG